MPEGLPFRLTDYLELLDWTGRSTGGCRDANSRQQARGEYDHTDRVKSRVQLEQWQSSH